MKTEILNPVVLTYGPGNLGGRSIFQGGYINFGYWKNINIHKEISIEERIKASENLYDFVIDFLNIQTDDAVLEMGCGQGYGLVRTALHKRPKKIVGVDLTLLQIERAKLAHKVILDEFSNIEFLNCPAHHTPFMDCSFTKILSVEAMQCFPSIVDFAQESMRLLAPGGSIVLAAHFATDCNGYNEVKKLIPTVDEGIDRLIPIQKVRSAFQQVGFQEVHFQAIGDYVFEGFDRWIAQVGSKNFWSRNVQKAFVNNYLDYYVLLLRK